MKLSTIFLALFAVAMFVMVTADEEAHALDDITVFEEISFEELEVHEGPKVVLFIDSLEEASQEMYVWLEKVMDEVTSDSFNLPILRCEKQREENSSIFSHEGFADLPIVFVQTKGESHPSIFGGEFTEAAFREYIEDSRIEPDFETVHKIAHIDEIVSIAQEVGKPIILKHYEEWCGHCKALKPKYAKAAMKSLDTAVFAEVECSSSDDTQALCNANGVRGFPTIKAFNGVEFIDYNGSRSTADLINFAADIEFTPVTEEVAATIRSLETQKKEEESDEEFEDDEDFEDIVEEVPEDTVDIEAAYETFELTYPKWEEWLFSKLETDGEPKLIIFQDVSDEETIEFNKLVDSVLVETPEWTFPVVRVERGRGANASIMEHFPNLPFVFMIAPGSPNPQPYQGEKTFEGIHELITDSLVELDDSAVITVSNHTKKDLEAIAAEAGKPLIIKCFEEWCGHCRGLKPDYIKAAMKLADNALVYEVECSKTADTQALCKSFDVTGYPTVKTFNGKKWADYTGARSASAIHDTLISMEFVEAGEEVPVGDKVKNVIDKGIKGIKNIVGKKDEEKAEL